MRISALALKRVAYLCLLCPCLIFLIGFLKWYVGVPVALLLVVAYFFAAIKKDTDAPEGEQGDLVLAKKHFFILLGVIALWCWLAGIGNLYYQSADWWARNAVFRDLITRDWPVIYPEKNAALVYYVGYWLPSALVGKFVLAVTAGNANAAFFAGNIALLCWSGFCVTLVMLLALSYLRASGGRQILVAAAVFIFFSGLDIIGTLCDAAFMGHAIPDHIEWWAFLFQFSSMTTALFWVFHQVVTAWLVTLCILRERTSRNDLFLLVCALVSTPLACAGLAVYVFGFAVLRGCRALAAGEGKHFLKTLFTPQNLLPVLTALPIFILYYKSNLALGLTKWQGLGLWALIAIFALIALLFILMMAVQFKRGRILHPAFYAVPLILIGVTSLSFITERVCPLYLAFLLLECGIYLILLYVDRQRDPLYYLTLTVFLICPLVMIGTSADFSMRASIPAVTVLCLMCIRFLLDRGGDLARGGKRRVLPILMIAALAIGAVTPIFEIVRGIVAVIRAGDVALVNDGVGTFARIFPRGVGTTDKNFIAVDYGERFFFRYLAGGGS